MIFRGTTNVSVEGSEVTENASGEPLLGRSYWWVKHSKETIWSVLEKGKCTTSLFSCQIHNELWACCRGPLPEYRGYMMQLEDNAS